MEKLIYSYFIIYLEKFITNFKSRKISVCIPHHNRVSEIHYALKNLIFDRRIAEIIILDDGSKLTDFKILIKKLKPFKSKIRLYRRDENVGAFITKYQAVQLAKNNWVLLLDSDNSIYNSFIDEWMKYYPHQEKTVYCPCQALPKFHYGGYAGDKYFDLKTVKNEIITKKFNHGFFNDGNYIFNKSIYLKSIENHLHINPSCSDVLFANYLMMLNGCQLFGMKKAKYYHRISENSYWNSNSITGIEFAEILKNKIVNDEILNEVTTKYRNKLGITSPIYIN